MATLSVLKFNDPSGADRVLIALQGLQEREMITLQDAAVLSWPQGNKNLRPASYTAQLARVPWVEPSGASCSG
jgi:uncharacterized membrane protein